MASSRERSPRATAPASSEEIVTTPPLSRRDRRWISRTSPGVGRISNGGSAAWAGGRGDVIRCVAAGWRAAGGGPRLVDDLDAKAVPRERVQDSVAVRRVAMPNPHADILRGERSNRLPHVERDRLGARGDPRIDDLAVPDDRDPGLSPRVDADPELLPFRFPSQELERLADGRVDVVDRHDTTSADPMGFRG